MGLGQALLWQMQIVHSEHSDRTRNYRFWRDGVYCLCSSNQTKPTTIRCSFILICIDVLVSCQIRDLLIWSFAIFQEHPRFDPLRCMSTTQVLYINVRECCAVHLHLRFDHHLLLAWLHDWPLSTASTNRSLCDSVVNLRTWVVKPNWWFRISVQWISRFNIIACFDSRIPVCRCHAGSWELSEIKARVLCLAKFTWGRSGSNLEIRNRRVVVRGKHDKV